MRGLCGKHELFYTSVECPRCADGSPPESEPGHLFGITRTEYGAVPLRKNMTVDVSHDGTVTVTRFKNGQAVEIVHHPADTEYALRTVALLGPVFKDMRPPSEEVPRRCITHIDHETRTVTIEEVKE